MGTLLYTPILNLLAGLYVIIPGSDLGLSIIALTLIIRLILHPSYANSLKAQRDLQNLQPLIDKIRIDLKDDRYRHPETAGVETILSGIARSTTDDDERIRQGGALFAAFYASARSTVADGDAT